jgi:hypothetical protein
MTMSTQDAAHTFTVNWSAPSVEENEFFQASGCTDLSVLRRSDTIWQALASSIEEGSGSVNTVPASIMRLRAPAPGPTDTLERRIDISTVRVPLNAEESGPPPVIPNQSGWSLSERSGWTVTFDPDAKTIDFVESADPRHHLKFHCHTAPINGSSTPTSGRSVTPTEDEPPVELPLVGLLSIYSLDA